jgi:hypothetical protein
MEESGPGDKSKGDEDFGLLSVAAPRTARLSLQVQPEERSGGVSPREGCQR